MPKELCSKGLAGYSTRNGAIAQLGERLICIQEVIGSIPFGSTICFLRRVVLALLMSETSLDGVHLFKVASSGCLDIVKRCTFVDMLDESMPDTLGENRSCT